MRISVLLALLGPLVTLVAAQGAPPSCATQCLTQIAVNPPAGCATTDVACLCNSPALTSGFQECLANSCIDPADQQKGIEFGLQYCAAAGVTVSVPTAGTVTDSIVGGGATDSLSAASSSLSAALSSGLAGASSSASGALSSSLASASSVPSGAPASISSKIASATSAANSKASSISSSLSGSPSASATGNTGAASRVLPGLGGVTVLAGLIGAIAAF